MARIYLRRKALELRSQGKTYSDIKKELNVAKSTLSDWLKDYPLSHNQLALLSANIQNNKNLGIEKVRLTKSKKREKRLRETYLQEKDRWITLSQRELELAGIFLYWGEGNKRIDGPISLNNTDPRVIKFTICWLVSGLRIPREKIKVYLHLYSDMDVDKEMNYWSNELQLPLSQFLKPYIKASKKSDIDQRGFGHGTCGVMISSIRLKEKIIMAINAISDGYKSGKDL